MNCNECIYAESTEISEYNGKSINEFECRRYPPTIFMENDNFKVAWPRVFAYVEQEGINCWCGEFSKKLLKEDVV